MDSDIISFLLLDLNFTPFFSAQNPVRYSASSSVTNSTASCLLYNVYVIYTVSNDVVS